MNNLLIQNLVDFGLTENEAKTYLATLELGLASASEIATHSEINRSTTYVVLESLQERGYVSVAEQKGVRRYTAAPPEIFSHIADERVAEGERLQHNIERILPDLNARDRNDENKPRIRIYEGVEGVKQLLNESLNAREKRFRIFTTGKNVRSLIPSFFEQWGAAGSNLGISVNGIFVDNDDSHTMSEQFPTSHYVVYVPEAHYPSPLDMMIWDNNVAYLNIDSKGVRVVNVTDRMIATAFKTLFDLAQGEMARVGKVDRGE